MNNEKRLRNIESKMKTNSFIQFVSNLPEKEYMRIEKGNLTEIERQMMLNDPAYKQLLELSENQLKNIKEKLQNAIL